MSVHQKYADMLAKHLAKTHGFAHTFEECRVDDMPWLDARFYQQKGEELEKEGFRYICTMESKTMSAMPLIPGVAKMPKVALMVYVNPKTGAAGAAFHIAPKLLTSMALYVDGIWRRRHTEIQTDFRDAVCTTSTLDKSSEPYIMPQNWQRISSFRGTTAEIVATHNQLTEGRTGALVPRTFVDVVESERRQFRQICDAARAYNMIDIQRMRWLGIPANACEQVAELLADMDLDDHIDLVKREWERKGIPFEAALTSN